jgi:(2R)-sulfolactate sulfo-lyase subunit beta
LALPHAFGRLQFGEDLQLTFDTLIGTGVNANVAAVVVIGIEPKWTQRVADGIAKTGKPVAAFSIEGKGDLQVIQEASRVAAMFLQDASGLVRTEAEMGDMIMSIKCGESDTTSGLGSCPTTSQAVDRWVEAGGTVFFGETSELTGGEHLIAERCIDAATRDLFQVTYDNYIKVIEATGANLLGSQPTQGNIAGGLTTIEEKALGNIAKTGSVPVVGVLKPAEMPNPANPGLYFMDSSSAAAECVTLMAAGGAVIHLFPTGQGNVIGNPIVPVLKLTANIKTAKSMTEHIDLDVSGLLRYEYDLTKAGDMMMDVIYDTVSEDVWGTPFQTLEGSFPITRNDDLWNNPEELKAALKDVKALVVRNRTKVTADVIAAAPGLKVIARAGVGLDNIDLKAADAAGVVVVAGLGANAVSVGELTLGLALSLLRNVPGHDVATRDGGWVRIPGRELSGLTWGLLGCGATGVATAKLIQGFNCSVLGYDPYAKNVPGVELTSFEDVLKRSDVVSIHMPSTPETNGSINAATLALMKKDAIIVNVGRGEVINEADLIAALKAKTIAGAALDVRAQEPPTTGEMETIPNLILTPHVAGITKESQLRINQILTANIELVLNSKPATHAVGALRESSN